MSSLDVDDSSWAATSVHWQPLVSDLHWKSHNAGFVLEPQGFAVVGSAYGFAGFAYGSEVSQSRETSTAAAAAAAAAAFSVARKDHNRPLEAHRPI